MLHCTIFYRISLSFIDTPCGTVNKYRMELDDYLPRRNDDPVAQLGRQDLDTLSVTELERRIALLQTEIERIRAKISTAVNHKASAEALFKK